MKVERVEDGNSLQHLDIEVPPEKLAEEFDKGVQKLRRTIRLPGFRKGKIPKEVIKTRFREDVMHQTVQDMVPLALGEALRKHKLHPISDPRISNLVSELGKPLKFRASFDVLPEFKAKDYTGIKVKKQCTDVTEEQIDKGVDSLRENAARFDPIEERGALDGDFIIGNLTERPADGGQEKKHEGVSIELGGHSYHKALHEKVQGARAGDTVSFSATFPPDHPEPGRGGKSFEVDFALLELKQKVLPELDDDLAKDVSDFDSLEELRTYLRKEAEQEARRQDDLELKSQLFDKLIAANAFDAPESLIEHELNNRLEEMARGLAQRGIDPQQADINWESLRADQREAGVKTVKATIILERIVAQEELKETEEDVEKEIEATAQSMNKSVEVVRAHLMKEGGMNRLRHNLRREKAVDFIKQHAKLK